ncbi:MAG TPA: PASTA domain-containing protein [Capillimicrobium sp.]|jgi:serine/threonine-protein kinase
MLRDVPGGTMIDGRYRVISRVGSGGMADVYSAEDTQLGRQVAVKLLHRRFAEDREFVERFRREASSAAGLQHPNVVSVYDRGEWDGTSYIAMEFLDGRTLKRVIDEEAPLPAALAIDLAVQILRAARFAHKRGIIHRDLKPHNVIVDAEHRAKVTDFGIARAGASDMTQTGSIMGTAQYLSPEQAQGQPVIPQSDLYSIGIVLYEMLAGRLPFDGESAVTIALKHVNEAPIPPSQFNSAVTPELEEVVLRALAKDPAQRYPDADAFILALDRARAGLGSVAAGGPGATAAFAVVEEPPPVEELLADDERRGRRWWIALLVALLVAGIAVAAYALTRPEQRSVPNVTGQPLQAALAVLSNAGFDPSVERTTSDAPEGRVLRQDPQPGTEAEVGSEVTLTVSDGPGQATVPDVGGDRRRAATRALEQAGFEVAVREETSDSVAAGRAVGTAPAAGTLVEVGSSVTLIVSTGPPLVAVPDVLGQDEADARSALETAGLSVDVEEQEDSEAEPGTVTSQDPAAGEEVEEGTVVTLVVAVEPATVAVPDVLGQSVDRAVSLVAGADLVPDQVTEPVGDQTADGVVIRQSPVGGREAERGSTVTLTIGEYDPALDPSQPDETTPPPEEDPDDVPPVETIPEETP